MLNYIKSKRAKSSAPVAAPPPANGPVLTIEDEEFLERMTSDAVVPADVSLPPTPPARPQFLLDAEVEQSEPLSLVKSKRDVDDVKNEFGVHQEPAETQKTPVSVKDRINNARAKWTWTRKDSRDAKKKDEEHLKTKDQEYEDDADEEAKREAHEMADALEGLNLAAVDNKVFSISQETKELLAKFTLILKDLMNGVPTAYHDLESLLTNSDDQLQRSYKHLPEWLQKIVQQLPAKIGKSVTPEMLAAAAEKHGVKSKYADMAAKGASKAGLKASIPSLKDLVTKPGAIAGILKAILDFLKLRFPAFLGLNVLYSLGLMVLLMILWYCWKRGREVRLDKERVDLEGEMSDMTDDEPRPARSSRSMSPSSAHGHDRREEALPRKGATKIGTGIN